MSELISIIVPVYNVAEYLTRCLDSILAQTYRNIEIIAVNDGSTDSSGDILDAYSSKYRNIKVIHQKNAGVSMARMRGIDESNGVWIGFVDADDYIEPEMYETLYSNAIKHNADISHCGHKLIHLDGNIHYFYNTKKCYEHSKESGLTELLSGTYVEPALWTKLFRKSLFENVENFDYSIKFNEDLLLNYLCFKRAQKSVYFDVCPYHYFARETSATRDYFNVNKLFDPIKVRKFILDDAAEELKELATKMYLNKCIDAYSVLVLSQDKQHKETLSELKSILLVNKCHFRLLGIKRRIMVNLLLHFPPAYKLALRVQARFSNNIYY